MLHRLAFFVVTSLLAFPALADSISGSIQAPVPKFRANAVIFVKQGPPAPVAKKTVTMDQKGLVFVPRVLPIQKDWTVEFLNSDPVAHNVFTVDGEKSPFAISNHASSSSPTDALLRTDSPRSASLTKAAMSAR